MWMKVDDRMHSHRKTRAVTKSHEEKRRDVAPMGLWITAGSWAGQNNTNGWVPEDELDRWEDNWESLAKRLVAAGYWWPEERDGEPGYGFVDWEDYNPSGDAAKSGSYGNHVRWHLNRSIVDPECDHCPTEPDSEATPPDDRPESGGDIGGRSGGDIAPESRNIALPDPTRPDPTRPVGGARKRATQLPNDWEPNDRHREMAVHDMLDLHREAQQFKDHALANGKTFKDWDAAFRTWLTNSAKWNTNRNGNRPAPPPRNLQRADQLELPPDGLSDEEYAAWYTAQQRKHA